MGELMGRRRLDDILLYAWVDDGWMKRGTSGEWVFGRGIWREGDEHLGGWIE